MKQPLDPTPYAQDPDSKPIGPNTPDGLYVYVQDEHDAIWVLPDGPHRHPNVLGHARPAKYAGDLTVSAGKIKDVTNLSGTFQFDDEAGLRAVAEQLRQLGLQIEPGAVRFFPPDGSRPVVLAQDA
jgi:hypothetical protein